MKRLIALLLSAALLLAFLTACAPEQEPPHSPVAYFYPTETIYSGHHDKPHFDHSTTVLRAEAGEAVGHEKDYLYLTNMYFHGPKDASLHNPFPKGLAVLEFRMTNNTVILELSSNYASLSGIDLTIASACIAKTLHAMTGCNRVQLSAYNAFLDGSPFIFIDCNDLMEIDIPVLPSESPTESTP